MIIECLKDSPITIDKHPIIENLRINITKKSQVRVKFNLIDNNGDKTPIDVVIYTFTTPKLEVNKPGISIDVKGEEYGYHIPFRLTLTYHFLQKMVGVKGMINYQPINEKLKTPEDAKGVLSNLKSFIKL